MLNGISKPRDARRAITIATNCFGSSRKLRILACGLLKDGLVLLCAVVIGVEPVLATALPQAAKAAPIDAPESNPSVRSRFASIGANQDRLQVFGLSVGRPKRAQLASVNPEIHVLVACEGRASIDARLLNLTAGCAAFRVLSNAPVELGVPYDPSTLPEGIAESEIRLFKQPGIALASVMMPVDAYLDIDNKATITTLSEQSGRFIAGVLKPGERPEKALANFSAETLKGLRQADPTKGIPKLAVPQANNHGDLRLTYPLDLPGVRESLKPQISIDYSAQSSAGNIANGWNLSVPTITVETRWGVPIYDPKLETETYLFNGEQLVPEAGEAFVDAQSGASRVGDGIRSDEKDALDRRMATLNLVPQPHRTTHLRPRKTGKAHFVLRRDEGLWRFVRHGDEPSSYWWEAWQENPAAETARVMYFGRAPGRIAGDIEPVNLVHDMSLVGGSPQAYLDLGPKVGLQGIARSISTWGLAREKDAFGNIIDYEWVSTCLDGSNQPCPQGSVPGMLMDRGLYLKRVLFTGHQDIEETILRCRERPSAKGCLRKQGLFELNLFWTPDDKLGGMLHRSDARSGGLVVQRRLLEKAELRFRRRDPYKVDGDKRNAVPLHLAAWQCSAPFLSYGFQTQADPLYQSKPGARRWLRSITKYASVQVTDRLADEDAIFPAGMDGRACLGAPLHDTSSSQVSHYEMRFDYRKPALDGANVQAFSQSDPTPTKFPDSPTDRGALVDSIRTVVEPIGQLGDAEGPFAASKMGAVETESFNAGLYVGFGVIPLKGLSGGAKFTYSRRTSHRESTLLLDVNGDGILDCLVQQDGRWVAYLGSVDSSGHLSFAAAGTDMQLPSGFRFQHEPVMETTNSGGEAHVYGVIAGALTGNSHTVQTVQLADMDGDGRIDVVTPGGVFYNTSTSAAGAINYQFAGNTPFILNGTGEQPAAAPVLQSVAMPKVDSFPASNEHPRFDVVRTWRAPFNGLVRITGNAAGVAANDVAEEVWGVEKSARYPGRERQPRPDKLLPAPHRDGVIVAVERSSGSTVQSCSAGHLGPRVLDRLTSPEPAGPGSWSILGARLTPRDGTGTAVLDYRMALSGRAFLGLQPKPWTSSIRVRPIGRDRMPLEVLKAAIDEAIVAWNDQYGKDAAGAVVGMMESGILVDSAGNQNGVRLTFSGEMQSVPPFRMAVKIEYGADTQLMGIELDTIEPDLSKLPAKDQDGSPSDGHSRVETRIVPSVFNPVGETCAAGHQDLDAAKLLLSNNGIESSLLAKVDKGDVFYFRVHSIDNGEDDAVRWSPRVDYLSASEQLLPASASGPTFRKIIGPGHSGSPDSFIVAQLQAASSICLAAEQPAFCDMTGRSMLRYKLTDFSDLNIPGDLAPMALPIPGTLAPLTGAVEFSGIMEKPATIGGAYLEYVIVPIEVLATHKATHLDGVSLKGATEDERNAGANPIRSCDADATRIGRSITIAGKASPFRLEGGKLNLEHLSSTTSALMTEMAPDAGRYRILKSGWLGQAGLETKCDTRANRRANPADCGRLGNELDIRAGDKICLFVRSKAPNDSRDPDADATLGYWPIDAAGFRIAGDGPLALSYNTELAPVPKDADRGENPAAPYPPVECIGPLGDRPALGEDGKAEPSANPNETVWECRQGSRKLFAVPHIQNGPASVANFGHLLDPVPPPPPGQTRATPVRSENPRRAAFLPRLAVSPGVNAPKQSCVWGQQQDEAGNRLYERRFALEIRGIGPAEPNPSVLGENYVDPARLDQRLGERVAKLRTRVLAWRDGKARELPVKRFAVFEPFPPGTPGGAGLFTKRTRALSPGALVETPDPVPGTIPELLYDHREPQQLIAQNLRFVRGVTGTTTFSNFSEERKAGGNPSQYRVHELPSSHAGFAVCAAEDEEIVLETAIDDRIADGLSARSLGDQLDRLLGAAPCAKLPTDQFGKLDPSEDDNSNVPLSRGNDNVCPLGPARILLAELNAAGNAQFTAGPTALSIAHRLKVSPEAAISPRGRLPIETITTRSVAVSAIRHRADAPAGASEWDIKDPVLPDSFPGFPKNPANAPLDNANALASLPSFVSLVNALRNLPYERDYLDLKKAEASGRKHRDAAAFALVPEFRAGRETVTARADKASLVDKSGTTGPATASGAAATVDLAHACQWPPVQTLPQKSRVTQGEPAEDVKNAKSNGPALEVKSTWARDNASLAAAAGTYGGFPSLCLTGRDQAIWTFGEYISASRLGSKDLHFGSKLVAYDAYRDRSNLRIISSPTRGVGLVATSKRSDTKLETLFADFGAGVSTSKSKTSSDQDAIDLNGDGFPDLVAGGTVIATDARGGNRCAPTSPWARTHACNSAMAYPASPLRKSGNQTDGTSFGFPSAKKSAEIAVASARAAFTSSSGGTSSNDKGQHSQESFFPLNINVDRKVAEGDRIRDVMDVNGDGLPDIVQCVDAGSEYTCGKFKVRLNLGNGFDGSEIEVDRLALFGERSRNLGLGLTLGFAFPLNDNSMEGGLAASSATGDQYRTMADVNGDGLIDILEIGENSQIKARLNTGWGFTDVIELGKAAALNSGTFGRSETDNAAAGGAYTWSTCLYPIPVCFHINPNAGLSGALTRQSIVFRDADGDGLSDFIVGDSLLQGPTSLKLKFSRENATVVANRLGQHGLLERVWLPTNPSSDQAKANLEFAYARTSRTVQDPNHRWVIARVTARDGVGEDDAADVSNNSRHTCFSYADGRYDRFERQFVGYSGVYTVEGCNSDARTPIEVADREWAVKIAGVRRTERRYANGSIFEAGLLVEERVYDISQGTTGNEPRRTLRQDYVLVDTALSNPARVVCHHLRHVQPTDVDRKLLALGLVRNVYLAHDDQQDSVEQLGCRKTFPAETETHSTIESVFDTGPRRLTPVLVQIVRETAEGEAAKGRVLRTAVQYNLDDAARPRRVCDLGEILEGPGVVLHTRGTVCSDVVYDDTVRPRFTHGATGGGTIFVEQRNRIKEVLISDRSGKLVRDNITSGFDAAPDKLDGDGRLLRRRTASNDTQTGTVLTLCHFLDAGSTNDPCARAGHFPELTFSLEQAARAGVVMRAYNYDEFGNLVRYVGPIGSGKTYAAKAYSFDPYISLIETAERTEHCGPSGAYKGSTICLSGSKPQLGSLNSYGAALDYRHAVATVSIDVNRNATYVPLDQLARPTKALVSWKAAGPSCGAECAGLNANLTTGMTFTQIAAYAYGNPALVVSPPSAIITRFVDSQAYSDLPNKALLSKMFFDQFGVAVQSIVEASVCKRLAGFSDAACDEKDNYSASGVVRKDRINRPVSDAYPVSLTVDPDPVTDPNGPTINLAKQGLLATEVGRNQISFDGLDRPLTVQLPDGNGYDLQYAIEPSENPANPILRHRTSMRNALCAPSAIERDVRGAIRGVVESYETTTVHKVVSAAEGSNPPGMLPNSKLVADVIARDGKQQIYACLPARAQPFALASNRSVASYDRDALGQLVAIRLPRRSTEVGEKIDAILVGYDALGRRVLVDDPDRGFERIVMDLSSNSMCTYSGPRRGTLSEPDRPKLDFEEMAKSACRDPKTGKDAPHSERDLRRVVRTDFIVNLPRKTTYKLFSSDSKDKDDVERAAKREIAIEYGKGSEDDGKPSEENRKQNRVGRPYKTVDMVGMETKSFDALGRAVRSEREFSKLDAMSLDDGRYSTLVVEDSFDLWGPHKSRTFSIKVPGKAATGKPKPPAANISESMEYRYNSAGQLLDVLAGSNPGPGAAKSPLTAIASDMMYDARGNLLSMNYATGVGVRHSYDEKSNRLMSSMARMGSPLADVPRIYFQNVDYRYDAAGNVLAYNNKPIIAEPCTLPLPEIGCSEAIPPLVAQRHGLLISNSQNSFSYDQSNRIRAAKKSLTSLHTKRTDREGEPNLLDDTEIAKAPKLTADFDETFAFYPTHEMALQRRAEVRAVEVTKPATKTSEESKIVEKTTATFTSVYTSDGDPRHAPGKVNTFHDEGKFREITKFGFDDFGRMTASLCDRPDKKGCRPDRYFDWNVDDSLRSQIVQTPSERLPKSKTDGANKPIIYYDHVQSEYDASGQRSYKKLTEQHIRKVNGKDKVVGEPFVSDTLYADAQLTISRREGQAPQAIMHYFAGPLRVASKWVGDERMFTYHAQLLTRNVSDVVVGSPGKAETARLNGQQEYAAFGQVLHERETLLAGNKDGTTNHAWPGLPRYRFNAKEQDESGLQDFGARFYDNNLAVWLRPDPILHDYLGGRNHGGVYTPKNLASYGFGWGNPIRYGDSDGTSPFESQIDERYFTDDSWTIVTVPPPTIFALYFRENKSESGGGGVYVPIAGSESLFGKMSKSGGIASRDFTIGTKHLLVKGIPVDVAAKISFFGTYDREEGLMAGMGTGPEVSVGPVHVGAEVFHLSGWGHGETGILAGGGWRKNNFLLGAGVPNPRVEPGGKLLRLIGDFQRNIEYWIAHPTYNAE